jgi:hypothetical protein
MMLRDDCALNLWRIQIAPKPQACSRYTDFPKSLGHARGHCGAHFKRLVDANKIIIQEVQLCLLKTSSAAEILVRYRPKCGPETRSKFEFSIRTRKFPVPLRTEFYYRPLNSLADWARRQVRELIMRRPRKSCEQRTSTTSIRIGRRRPLSACPGRTVD